MNRLFGWLARTAGVGFTVMAMSTAAAPTARLIQGQRVPTGMRITPSAAPGAVFTSLNPGLANHPDYRADHAVSTAISPDGRTMLVLTSGYNRLNAADGSRDASASEEYVFVYDISQGRPVKRQVLHVPDTYIGLAWNPNTATHPETFYVSGGVDDDVHVYTRHGGVFVEDGTPISLGHAAGNGPGVASVAAGLSVSADGARLLVANIENDSLSLIDLDRRETLAELDLRPGVTDPARTGVPGGEYPVAVAFDGNDRAYVSSQRDREIDVVARSADDRLHVTDRIALDGQPNKLLFNHDHSRLYVAADNSDQVVVIDPEDNDVVQTVHTVAPASVYRDPAGVKGATPNSLRLSPDEHWLFVTNGGTNAVAVIRLAGAGLAPGTSAARDHGFRIGGDEDDDDRSRDSDRNDDHVADARDGHEHGRAHNLPDHGHDSKAYGHPGGASQVVGLIPTGWYPESVNVSPDGRWLYVTNSKDNAGPNPGACRDTLSTTSGAEADCRAHNQYVWQLEQAGLLALPMPDARTLGRLTRQVAYNDGFLNARTYRHEQATMRFLARHIRHVVYVVKENRTYDQILGDLPEGNGDPSLALLGPYTPNHHAWATQFVDLDNFYDSGEVSNVGWNWSTAARTTDYTEKAAPVNYAGRGFTYDWEGVDRNINVGLPTVALRQRLNPDTPTDPNLLPGTADIAAPDGPGRPDTNEGRGYIWNDALRHGRSVINFGFFGDLSRYSAPANSPAHVPLSRHPAADGVRQFFPDKQALLTRSDPYFRGFDNKYPDFYREAEFERRFDQYVAHDNLPNLVQVRLMHDHFGNFARAIDGVNTVATQMADNDYAVGRLIDRIAHSPYADNTLIFVIEDDAQNGADHVDAHRSVGFVVGPYVRHHAVVSKYYTTVSMLRTIEEVLGIGPMGLNDALAAPMTDVFDIRQRSWTYHAVVPAVLRATALPLPPANTANTQRFASHALAACFSHSLRDAAYWQRVMAGEDFAVQDQLDTGRFNQAVWHGLMGDKSRRPTRRAGADLSADRPQRLSAHRAELTARCARMQHATAGR